jgi:hypothetical protein
MHYNQIQPFAFWLLDSGSFLEPGGAYRHKSEVRDHDLSEHI